MTCRKKNPTLLIIKWTFFPQSSQNARIYSMPSDIPRRLHQAWIHLIHAILDELRNIDMVYSDERVYLNKMASGTVDIIWHTRSYESTFISLFTLKCDIHTLVSLRYLSEK